MDANRLRVRSGHHLRPVPLTLGSDGVGFDMANTCFCIWKQKFVCTFIDTMFDKDVQNSWQGSSRSWQNVFRGRTHLCLKLPVFLILNSRKSESPSVSWAKIKHALSSFHQIWDTNGRKRCHYFMCHGGEKGPANYTMMSYFLSISAITGTSRHFSEVEMWRYGCCEITKYDIV